jgi:hypothetical protein
METTRQDMSINTLRNFLKTLRDSTRDPAGKSTLAERDKL